MPNKKQSSETIPGTELTTEQVKEVTDKKRRRGYDALSDFNAEPGENSRFIRFAMSAWNLPPIDISDPKQVEQRIGEYFQHCADCDRRPQVVGMCNWLGISRQTMNEWLRGEVRKDTHGDIIKKAYSFLEEMWAEAMLTNRLNPATGCFIGKNWYQYSDTQQIIVTPNNPMQGLDADTARQRLIESIPDEDE
jgi:hypothetical protein